MNEYQIGNSLFLTHILGCFDRNFQVLGVLIFFVSSLKMPFLAKVGNSGRRSVTCARSVTEGKRSGRGLPCRDCSKSPESQK